MLLVAAFAAACCLAQLAAADTNGVYEPCNDARIQRGDGFTFGVAFAGLNSFFSGQTQLSPCDHRLNVASSAQLAVFRPKVDEISLLTINTTSGFNLVSARPISSPVSTGFLYFLVRVGRLGGSGGACVVRACGNVGVGTRISWQ
jgi:hypothetical protein